MSQTRSRALVAMGTVTMLVAVIQHSGCNSYSDCDYYAYCDVYGPYTPDYGYNSVYYSTVPPAQYGQADPSLAEQTPEKITNVEDVLYIAKTDAPTEDDQTPADFEERYPCGSAEEALTVCADADADPDASDRLMIMFQTEEAVPLADSLNHFVIGFAFDADNVADNNFVPEQDQGGDYFGHTDKWYKTTYTPTEGWTLEVFDASGPTPVTVASHARFVIRENVGVIVIPTSEFAVPNPAVRISIFRHTGDSGLGADHDWSGLVYPKPGERLIKPNVAPNFARIL